MAKSLRKRDEMKLWRDSTLLGGMELLRASCRQHRYAAHSHDYFVIAAFERGAQRHKIARHTGIAQAGSVMVIPPGEVHTRESATRDGVWEYSAFYPSAHELADFTRGLFDSDRGSIDFGRELVIDDPQLAASLLSAHRVAESSGDALDRESAVSEAMGLLIRRYGQRTASKTKKFVQIGVIKQATDYINHMYATRMSAKQIAAITGLSEYHFMRVFRARTGLTVHSYVTQVRLERAKGLLADGVTATDTAYSVGFFDQSHLTNQFRTHFGVTPGEFAAACR